MTSQRTASKRPATLVIAALGFIAFGLAPVSRASAQAADGASSAKSSAGKSFAQARPKSKRARTRIRVYPAYPYRLESTPYPTPYEYEYPGPNAVRQCAAQLVQEYRPSGTVIVPRMQCWWERG